MEDQNVVVQTYPVRLRSRGQITVSQAIRERLAVNDGDFLVLVEIGDLMFLAPKPLQVPRLADKLADLLQGLEEERIAIWNERNH